MKDIVKSGDETLYTDYEIPEDDSVIWRFLDLAKFISLLKDKALFMTRADKFEDQFEGAVCALKDSEKYDEALHEYYSDMLECKVVPEKLIEDEHKANQLLRMNSYINCWYEGKHESMAMWRLYASGKETKGVAIKTTVGQLRKAIGREVEIGRIDYIDYSKEWPNVNEALWRKRLSFEYEHEVRIRITPKTGLSYKPDEFLMLQVDLNELIEAVYVSPMSESWFKDVVADVLARYGLEKPVFHSGLDEVGAY
jgi:hypothetical protein